MRDEDDTSTASPVQLPATADVAERLLGDRNVNLFVAHRQPDESARWMEPKPAQPVHKFITTLIRSNSDPRLRSRRELAQYGVECPYRCIAARILWAVSAARAAVDDDASEQKRRWRRQERLTRLIINSANDWHDIQFDAARAAVVREPILEPAGVFYARSALVGLSTSGNQAYRSR